MYPSEMLIGGTLCPGISIQPNAFFPNIIYNSIYPIIRCTAIEVSASY